MINYLIPAFGFALGVLWLSEPVTWREMIALLFILAAIALVRSRPSLAATSSQPEVAQLTPKP
jgi:drug/metabolite transporter (DMT)-like permease